VTAWPQMFTCCYGRFKLISGVSGVPVRTSNGTPKWLSAPMASAESLMPSRWLLYGGGADLPPDEWKQSYMDRLTRHYDEVVDDLNRLAAEYPDRPLVFLCFEDKPSDCHRSMIAEWMHDRWGIDVPELTPPQEQLF
jgi:hypothetical protein